jgi:magnesium-transporting ATPase (P-type)
MKIGEKYIKKSNLLQSNLPISRFIYTWSQVFIICSLVTQRTSALWRISSHSRNTFLTAVITTLTILSLTSSMYVLEKKYEITHKQKILNAWKRFTYVLLMRICKLYKSFDKLR